MDVLQTRLEHLRLYRYRSFSTSFGTNRSPSFAPPTSPCPHLPFPSGSSRTHHIHHSLTPAFDEPCSPHFRCTLYVRNARPLSIRPRRCGKLGKYHSRNDEPLHPPHARKLPELPRNWRRRKPMGAAIFPFICLHRRFHCPQRPHRCCLERNG